jgi:hypothetical protein
MLELRLDGVRRVPLPPGPRNIASLARHFPEYQPALHEFTQHNAPLPAGPLDAGGLRLVYRFVLVHFAAAFDESKCFSRLVSNRFWDPEAWLRQLRTLLPRAANVHFVLLLRDKPLRAQDLAACTSRELKLTYVAEPIVLPDRLLEIRELARGRAGADVFFQLAAEGLITVEEREAVREAAGA